MGIEISKFTSLKILKNQTKKNHNFSRRIEFVEDFFKLGHLEVEYLGFPFFISVATRKTWQGLLRSQSRSGLLQYH